MAQRNDLSRSRAAFHQGSTLVAVVELSRSSWLVAGIVPGFARQPVKKLDASAEALGVLLRRWQDEAAAAGRAITRLAVAFEAGRDGFRPGSSASASRRRTCWGTRCSRAAYGTARPWRATPG